MARVLGVGGVFFKSKDAESLRKWYADHLGIASNEHGATFPWQDKNDPARDLMTVWCIFPASTKYFDSKIAGGVGSPMMLNYIVDDLAEMLGSLRAAGVPVDDKVDDSEYGKFGWAQDPDGNRIELWEPPKAS